MSLFKTAVLSTSLLVAANAFAEVTCPSTAALKSEGLTMTAMVFPYFYLDYQISNFDTDNNWLFAVGPIQCENEEIALEEGNKLMKYLTGNPSPEEDENGSVICTYSLGDDQNMAVAFLDGSLGQVKSHFHR